MYNFVKVLIKYRARILFVGEEPNNSYINLITKSNNRVINTLNYSNPKKSYAAGTVLIGDNKTAYSKDTINYCFSETDIKLDTNLFDLKVNLAFNEIYSDRKSTPLQYGNVPKPVIAAMAKRSNCQESFIIRDLNNVKENLKLMETPADILLMKYLANAGVSITINTLDENTTPSRFLSNLLSYASNFYYLAPLNKNDRNKLQDIDMSALTEWSLKQVISGEVSIPNQAIVPIYNAKNYKNIPKNDSFVYIGYGDNMPKSDITLLIRNNKLLVVETPECKIHVNGADTYLEGSKQRFLDKYTNKSNNKYRYILNKKV